MASRSARAALRDFLDPVRRTLSCGTESHVSHTGHRTLPSPLPAAPPPPHTLTLVPPGGSAGEPAPLRWQHGRRGVELSVVLQYRVIEVRTAPAGERFRVLPSYYAYELLTETGRELLVYHWHPEDPLVPTGASEIPFPHLHLPEALRPVDLGGPYGTVDMLKMHVPTGPIHLAAVVGLLIREFGVTQLRDDWIEVLEERGEGRSPSQGEEGS